MRRPTRSAAIRESGRTLGSRCSVSRNLSMSADANALMINRRDMLRRASVGFGMTSKVVIAAILAFLSALRRPVLCWSSIEQSR